ncbi:MAG: hypothetical protein ACRC28_04995 [Clostridium sp.]|uniref:hypothetical protein n=1 Tax=Clostridium sp. TaxID=1506 RepID=UPI003F3C2492
MENKQTPPEIKLSPPWYTYANQIKYTYGCSPHVCVGMLKEVDGKYVLEINVDDDLIAKNLRQILPTEKVFGGVVVTIKIYNTKKQEVFQTKNAYKNAEELADVVCSALKCNPFFGGLVLLKDKTISTDADVIGIIDNCVVQFYNDDISNICRNYTEVAAKVFEEITILQYPIGFTLGFVTYDSECEILKVKYTCK